jgi:hypothetical protein
MNNLFNIGDIVINNNLSRDDRHWLVVGFTSFKRLSRTQHYYKLVPLNQFDLISNPFDMEIEHIHDNYKKVS